MKKEAGIKWTIETDNEDVDVADITRRLRQVVSDWGLGAAATIEVEAPERKADTDTHGGIDDTITTDTTTTAAGPALGATVTSKGRSSKSK